VSPGLHGFSKEARAEDLELGIVSPELHDYDAEVEEWLAEHPDLNGDMQERVRAAAGKLMGSFVARKVLLDAEIERKEFETFPTPAHQPTFKSHRTRTIVAICGALLTLLLAALAAELIFSLTLM